MAPGRFPVWPSWPDLAAPTRAPEGAAAVVGGRGRPDARAARTVRPCLVRLVQTVVPYLPSSSSFGQSPPAGPSSFRGLMLSS